MKKNIIGYAMAVALGLAVQSQSYGEASLDLDERDKQIDQELSEIKDAIATSKNPEHRGRVAHSEIKKSHERLRSLEREKGQNECSRLQKRELLLRNELEEKNASIPGFESTEPQSVNEGRSTQGKQRAEALKNLQDKITAITTKIEEVQRKLREKNCD